MKHIKNKIEQKNDIKSIINFNNDKYVMLLISNITYFLSNLSSLYGLII